MQEGKIKVEVSLDFEDLIPRFLANRDKDVAALREGIAAGDSDTVRRIGHTMRGSGAGYGFKPISELGETIERAAQSGDFAMVEVATGELVDYLGRVDVVFVDEPPP